MINKFYYYQNNNQYNNICKNLLNKILDICIEMILMSNFYYLFKYAQKLN